MKSEHINVFLKSLISVSEMVLGEKLVKKEPFLKSQTTQLKDIAVIVGITGQLKGQVVISFNQETALGIASKMMGGMSVTELDDMAKSAVSEIGNMVLGTSSTELAELDIVTDITPPNLVSGQNMSMTFIKKAIVVPFDSTLGEIYLEISLED